MGSKENAAPDTGFYSIRDVPVVLLSVKTSPEKGLTDGVKELTQANETALYAFILSVTMHYRKSQARLYGPGRQELK